MRSATFLLNKHPYAQRAGDTRISRLLMAVAAESVAVRGVALWSGPRVATPIELTCVPKPPLRVPSLAVRSLARGRSLTHARYLTPELVRVVRELDDELLIAEHIYMAEAAIAAGRSGPGLAVNAHVLESSVLAGRAALERWLAPLRLEAARTHRDEVRCVRSAATTACLGQGDVDALQAAGLAGVHRLDLVLPPVERATATGAPTALFVGDRTWAPNAHAARTLLAAWPRISARAPGARLIIAGRPARRERVSPLPGVSWLGFVDDLEQLFRAATVLVAPLAIGGGVRVKVLEAAARGIPVVASAAGAGSIGEYLPIEPVSGDGGLAERAARLLSDPATARAEGDELYEANRTLWSTGFVHRGVEAWLARAEPSSSPDAAAASGAGTA